MTTIDKVVNLALTSNGIDIDTSGYNARVVRYLAVMKLSREHLLTDEAAKEILSGCLTPGDESTRQDDSELFYLTPDEARMAIAQGIIDHVLGGEDEQR